MPIRTIYRSYTWQFPPPKLQSLQLALREASWQVRDQSTISIAACCAWHISQPLCAQAIGLVYQPARRLVPATARMSQLEARGCDKAGLDGREGWEALGKWAHRQQYGEKWIYCGAVRHGEASTQRHKGPGWSELPLTAQLVLWETSKRN